MTLRAGERLGSYEILAPIGAGGMGEVYRARDSKLGREVAIKVLPEQFTQHPQKLARFEREARLLAALNHPGIATLYGVEEAENQPFLVMELVEGETLADRIARGPVPVEEALEISRQIAEALEAAHEKGVIHRDLKPANIKVDPEGKVKVLDFGLAKAFAEEVPESELSQSPTLSRDATRAGVILGTAAYMSPEQAKGKTVDKRTDIFSFGIVLYEMLTGKRAFLGEDVPEVLASIIGKEPDWKALPSSIDPRIQNLLRRCLRKDRKKRLRDAGDTRNEVEDILAEPAGVAVPASATGTNRERYWGVAGLVLGCLAAVVVGWSLSPQVQPPAIARFGIQLPPTQRLTHVGRRMVAFSPDGKRFAYTANNQLYLREIDQVEAVPIRGTDIDPVTPFFSPDGQWVGFYAFEERSLKKVPIRGGTAVTLCEALNPFGASWGPNDSIVFGQGVGGILRVSANGGTPEVVAAVDAKLGEMAYGPQILPDGETLLFTLRAGGSWDESQIVAQSMETGERRVLIEDGADVRYAPTGHLVYALGESLLAAPFDLARLEVTGGSVPVVEGVRRSVASTAAAQFSFSDDGSLLYVTSESYIFPDRKFVWVDLEGGEESVAMPPQSYNEFALSPDGTRLAVRATADNPDLWIYDLVRNIETRLTFDAAREEFPVWSSDGQTVAFGGDVPISRKASDGTGEVQRLAEESTRQQIPQAFSSDGTVLIFNDRGLGGALGMLELAGDRTSRILLDTEFVEQNATLSPDGRWLAYESNESGHFEVYVRPFPAVGDGRWQISAGGGVWPLWSPDTSELFYLGPETMMRAAFRTEPTFTVGRRESLFSTEPYYTPPLAPTIRRMAISPGGQRFLMLKPEADDAAQQNMILVQNWFEELERLVPTN